MTIKCHSSDLNIGVISGTQIKPSPGQNSTLNGESVLSLLFSLRNRPIECIFWYFVKVNVTEAVSMFQKSSCN